MWTVGYTLRWVLGVLVHGPGHLLPRATQAGFDAEKIMPLVLLKMPVGLRGLFMAVLLAALMSTISAMINVTSSVVINDFVKRYFAKDLSQKKLVRLGQIASVAAVLIGFVFSLSFTNIVTAWETMVFVVVTVILVPATLRWHYWRFGARAFVWSMGVSAVLISLRLILVKGLHASASLAIDVGLGLVTTIVAAALTKPADMEVLVKFYAKVRPFGFWGPVRRECVKRGLVPAQRQDAEDRHAQRPHHGRSSSSPWPSCRSTCSCGTGSSWGCGRAPRPRSRSSCISPGTRTCPAKDEI